MPEMITLFTERLKLRPFNDGDLQNLKDLDQDPEVMKYLGGKLVPTEELEAMLPKLIERQPKWVTYGTWMADELSTGETIGWFTLKPLVQLNNEYEVGYRLKKKFWGKGYATEGTKFLVDYGFKKLNLPLIIGCTDLANENSQKVLMKAGLKRVPDIPSPFPEEFLGTKIAKFEIHR
jgi:RimJ/RimL family protein N-acetyltransferase